MVIIRQSSGPAVLPDFRRAAILGRLLAAVALLLTLLALLKVQAGQGFAVSWFGLVRWVAPGLVLTLGALALASPWLARRHHPTPWGVALAVAAFALVQLSGKLAGHDVAWVPLGWVGVLSLLLMHYFALRERALSPALPEARLAALTARIRPHFLFNSLNAAISLIRSRPARAEMVLENLADLFRAQLADPGRSSTLAREVELARLYLAIEAERIGERLQVSWQLDAPDDALLPPLLLQPLVENAVSHGVETLIVPGEIRIEAALHRRRLVITILNPVADEPALKVAGNHMALGNIAERLALMFEGDATLSTERGADSFVTRLELPYRPVVIDTHLPAFLRERG
jgi:two-component system sensor histidine kinase AlgZ